MLEDKISDLKEFVRDVKVKTVAYAVAATIALVPVYGCGGDECKHDADCLKNEVCVMEECYNERCNLRGGETYCGGGCDPSRDATCHTICNYSCQPDPNLPPSDD